MLEYTQEYLLGVFFLLIILGICKLVALSSHNKK